MLFMLKQWSRINPGISANLPSDLKLYKDNVAVNIFSYSGTHGNGIQSTPSQHKIKITLSLLGILFSGVLTPTSLKGNYGFLVA